MSLADLVERAYDVWDDGTRCAARSHPGVAHKRRASDSVVTMLDTYDALQWESKDCDDDDAEIIGAFSSDDEADGEDSEKGAADDADDDSAGEVSLSAETLDLLKSHGKCKSIRRGWKIVSKDEAAELIQAVDGKKKQRPWKLLHLWDKYGWREGTVLTGGWRGLQPAKSRVTFGRGPDVMAGAGTGHRPARMSRWEGAHATLRSGPVGGSAFFP
jgi:hypothetical protein